MSRSGYTVGCDSEWSFICYRGAVKSALRGARGQSFLRELIAALDSMPDKRLIAHYMHHDGAVCALGRVAEVRGVEVPAEVEPEDAERLSGIFGIAKSMFKEIEDVNDSVGEYSLLDQDSIDRKRWNAVRDWAVRHLKRGEGERDE